MKTIKWGDDYKRSRAKWRPRRAGKRRKTLKAVVRQRQRDNAHKLRPRLVAMSMDTQSGRYQSHREIDRRLRQIERGQLREENGLVA